MRHLKNIHPSRSHTIYPYLTAACVVATILCSNIAISEVYAAARITPGIAAAEIKTPSGKNYTTSDKAPCYTPYAWLTDLSGYTAEDKQLLQMIASGTPLLIMRNDVPVDSTGSYKTAYNDVITLIDRYNAETCQRSGDPNSLIYSGDLRNFAANFDYYSWTIAPNEVLSIETTMDPVIEGYIQSIVTACGITANMTQTEALHRINAWFTNNFHYNAGYQDAALRQAMQTNTGVCYHYCKLYEYVCKSLNIPVNYVLGYDRNGSHSWISNTINGITYYTDPTWNASSHSERWFMLDYAQMSQDHRF